MYSTQDLADLSGTTQRFWVKEISEGRIPAIRIGKKNYRVAKADFETWVTEHAVTPRVDVVGQALADMSARV